MGIILALFFFGLPFLVTVFVVAAALNIKNSMVQKKSTSLDQPKKSSASGILVVSILAGVVMIFVVIVALQTPPGSIIKLW